MLPINTTIYEYTDIPVGMTCDEYRRRRMVAEHRHTRLGLLARIRRARG
jgi:hypothetical protein